MNTGFTSGGVNLANVQDCWIDNNSFTDCLGAAYIDTGSVDGLHVLNNTITRGWEGVGLSSTAMPKQNIEISNNNFSIQDRAVGGGCYGIFSGYGATSNLVVMGNALSFDSSGSGLTLVLGRGSVASKRRIFNNVVGVSNPLPINSVTGSGITKSNNLQPSGSPVPGL